ncbi:MAG: alpha/beta fold hydrolase, partial [Pseudomonadota bacterium]
TNGKCPDWSMKTMRGFDRPTLVLHGRQDAVLAPAVAWALGDVIPNASVVFIDQSGHLPFVEQPDAFAEAVERFLSKPDAPAR